MPIDFVKGMAKNSLDNANLLLAFGFFLLPFIFTLGISIFYGFEVNFAGFGLSIASELIGWIVSVAVIFFLLASFKGGSAKGRFSGIMTGYSFIFLARFFLQIVSFVLVLFLVPNFFTAFAEVQSNPDPLAIAFALDSLQVQSESIVVAGVAALSLVTLIVFLFALYLVYQLIANAGKSPILTNLLIFVIWAVVIAVVYVFLPSLPFFVPGST